jgi:ketosteroid isomerase-like protein
MLTVEESVIKLISLSEQGKFLEALQAFYAEDAVMQENNEPPRAGLANILEHERKAMAVFKEVHVNRAESFIVAGDRSAINWIYEYTDQRGRRHRLDELAYQQWRDGKIICERFYYNPEQMRIEITPEGHPFQAINAAATVA